MKLDNKQTQDTKILDKLVNTICAIANLGKNSEGYLYIGIADSRKDAKRIKDIYKIEPYEINEKFIVGIERECQALDITIDEYLKKIVDYINNSDLSDHTKRHVLSQIDTILYKDLTVIRITIPPQKEPTYVGDKMFIRQGNSTVELTRPKDIVAISSMFQS